MISDRVIRLQDQERRGCHEMKKTLGKKYPQLAGQWSVKNYPLMPSDISPGSNKRVWWKGLCGHEWQASIKNRANGAGCPYCFGNRLLKGFNDLATIKPELIDEWSEKNLPLTPDMVTSCSNKSVWWYCIHGHEWTARISDRNKGSGCPYCSGHKIYKGFNDLASRYPELSRQWSERNLPKRPDEVFPRSREKVWWKCRICGYEWQAVIDSRVKGSSCPVCAERAVKAGVNDLCETDPDLIKEWDYKRNSMIRPDQISRNSLRIVWWKCKHGHSWRAKVADRAIDKEPCHICKREFEKSFPDKLLRYYIKKAGFEVLTDYEELIGIPVTNYIEAKNTVIEISKPCFNKKTRYRNETVKTRLCKNAKVKLIRILKKKDKEFDDCVNITRMDESDEALAEAIVLALSIIKITVITDVKADREYLFKAETS